MQTFAPVGDYRSTIKYWHATGSVPRLTYGHGNDFSIPTTTERIELVAVAGGAVSRL